MAINKIQNLEAGGDVREKLNAVIDAANEVPNKVEKNPFAVPGNVAVWGAGGVLLDAGIQPGGGDQVDIPTWESVQFIPLPLDFVVQYNDKLFKNKVLDNLNNQPPAEGENDYWAETSKSQANSTPLWVAGTYISERAEVYYLDETTNTLIKYVLRAPAPFVSEDFSVELNLGYWQQIEGSPSWKTVLINSATVTEFVAEPWTYYLVDCTAAPVMAKMPNVAAGSTSEFWFTLQRDTHKLTITTEGGTQIICNDTSQIIPTLSGSMHFKGNGVDGYDLIEDTRQLVRVVNLTADRDFGTDNFENNFIYRVNPGGGSLNLNIPAATPILGDISIKARFELVGDGSFALNAASGLIGDAPSQVCSVKGTGFDVAWYGKTYSLSNDTRPKINSASITTYSLAETLAVNDPVTGQPFRARCTTTEDARFNPTTPTEISTVITANPTDPWQLVGASAIQGAIIGLVQAGNTDIFANVRRTELDVNFYVTYSKLSADLLTETLISQSVSGLVNSSTAQQLRITAEHAEFSMLETDYYVVRTYARKATTGSDPTLYQILEGSNPTRSTLEVPAAAIAHNALAGRGAANSHPGTAISVDSSGATGTMPTTVATVQDFFDAVDALVIPTSTTIDVNTLEPYDPAQAYTAGVYRSYVNLSSPNPQFQTPAIYQAVYDVAIGQTPETHPYDPGTGAGLWWYFGDNVETTTRATARGYCETTGELSLITGYKHNDSVNVKTGTGTVNVYVFDSASISSTNTVKPADIATGNPGRWVLKQGIGGDASVTDYENIIFKVAAPDEAYITRGFNWKISSVTEYGGTSTIKTSGGAAYTLGATVTAGDYLTVTNTTINARLVAIIQPA